jgi:Kef-type K+ transport system membrane component KefB
MSFETLAIIVLAGLVGPLLALPARLRVPVVVGELAAGVVLGPTVLDSLHSGNTTFALLANIGFALVMFVAGTHVPVRDPSLRSALATGALRAAGVGVAAVPLGLLLAHAFNTGHAALYAVLVASSSAAVILPVIAAEGLRGAAVTSLLPQVAIADSACIVALPLVIDPSRAGRAALGAVAVVAAAVVLYLALRYLEAHGIATRTRELSRRRKFALELRLDLLMLFGLAALATRSHVSIMLAGFSLGLVVSAIGEPRRLARQLFGITEGLFGPLFFVWLGASLDLRQLGHHPKYIVLGLLLGLAAVAAHGLMAATGQPVPMTLLASAQLGVPVAAATIGTQRHLLHPGEPAALILGALVTVAVTTVAATLAGDRSAAAPSPAARA